jgi:ribosome biogenesis GTPase A
MNRIKVQEDPPIFLFDTPGILSPSIKNPENGLRLALCGMYLLIYQPVHIIMIFDCSVFKRSSRWC